MSERMDDQGIFCLLPADMTINWHNHTASWALPCEATILHLGIYLIETLTYMQ